jgi:tRNA-specific 2-thiouridylase
VAPGKACVFYEGEGAGARVLGGGWIAKAEKGAEAERALRGIIDRPAVSVAL